MADSLVSVEASAAPPEEGMEVYGKAPPDAALPILGKTKGIKGRKNPKAGPKLTIRQGAFITSLTSPDSPTFGNKSRSALQAGYAQPEAAWQVLENGSVRNEVEKRLEALNMDSKVRLGILADIARRDRIETVQLNGNDEVISKTVSDGSKVQLLAIKEIGKLDGSYQRVEAAGHAARKAYDTYLTAWSKRLRASLAPQEPVDSTLVSSGDKQDIAVDVSGYVDEGTPAPDAVAGQGSALGGTPEEGGGEGVGGGGDV